MGLVEMEDSLSIFSFKSMGFRCYPTVANSASQWPQPQARQGSGAIGARFAVIPYISARFL